MESFDSARCSTRSTSQSEQRVKPGRYSALHWGQNMEPNECTTQDRNQHWWPLLGPFLAPSWQPTPGLSGSRLLAMKCGIDLAGALGCCGHGPVCACTGAQLEGLDRSSFLSKFVANEIGRASCMERGEGLCRGVRWNSHVRC